jgi:hypothetical protein
METTDQHANCFCSLHCGCDASSHFIPLAGPRVYLGAYVILVKCLAFRARIEANSMDDINNYLQDALRLRNRLLLFDRHRSKFQYW